MKDAKPKYVDYMILDQNGRSGPLPVVHSTARHLYSAKADMAREMCRIGMMAALQEKHGEDEKQLFLTPREVVDRACEIADLAVDAFEERGWLAELPTFDEMKAEIERKADLSGYGMPLRSAMGVKKGT